ncbi:MAG: hypothetical protein ACUVYA_19450, partial [Planctomycetota bacterium]
MKLSGVRPLLGAACLLVLAAQAAIACPRVVCWGSGGALYSCSGSGCSSGCPQPLAIPGLTLGNDAVSCVYVSSSQPVRYLDGLLLYRTPAVGFPSADGSWSFYLTYNNRPADAGASVDEHFGLNWYPSIPRLEFRPSGAILLIADGHTVAEFVWDAGQGKYLAKHGVRAEITLQSGYYRLRGPNGGVADFYATAVNRGKLGQTTSPYGRQWNFSYGGGSDGRGGTLLSQIAEPGGYGWTFQWSSLGASRIDVQLGGTPLATIRFDYYEYEERDDGPDGPKTGPKRGSKGDLKRITIDDDPSDASSPEREIYFRYWVGGYDAEQNPGQTHDLRMVVGPMNGKVAAKEQGKGLDSISTETLYANKYFDIYVQYDQEHRVWKEEVHNGACPCGGGRQIGEYVYQYSENPAQVSDYDTPKYAVEQVSPDGSRRFVELNRVGSAIYVVQQESGASGARRWAEVFEYDSEGQVVRHFHPSACDAAAYGFPSWGENHSPVAVLDDVGLVDAYAYTGASESSDRTQWGKLKARSVQKGGEGPPKKIEEFVYDVEDGRHLGRARRYRDANDFVETVYSYGFFGGNPNRVVSRTTTYPAVEHPASQGTAQRAETYTPSNGTLASIADENGVLTTFSYHSARGLLLSKTTDATGVDSLQLFETWDYDSWGRAIRHTIYDGPSAGDPKLKVERWLYKHLPAGSGGEDYYPRFVTVAYEHLVDDGATVSARDGLAHISVYDLDGNLVEEADGYRSVTGQSLASEFDCNATTLEAAFAGTEYARRSYVYRGGFLRKEHAWLNAQSASSPRYTTAYEYDAMGRRSKRVEPDRYEFEDHDGEAEGTVTEWEYDVRGNLVRT